MQEARTILLVDDEFTIRKLVSQSLQECGYEVLEAHCGRDAVELSEQHEGTIDLLLSDIVMPGGVTGVELARLLKLSRPDMKVILMSGYDQAMLAEDTEWPFIPKRFKPSTLMERVKHILVEDLPPQSPHFDWPH